MLASPDLQPLPSPSASARRTLPALLLGGWFERLLWCFPISLDFLQSGIDLIRFFLVSLSSQREKRKTYLIESHRCLWPSGLAVIAEINAFKKQIPRFKVMEGESRIREHMEKQMCEIQINSLLGGSALKQPGLLTGTELGKNVNLWNSSYLPTRIWLEWKSVHGRYRTWALQSWRRNYSYSLINGLFEDFSAPGSSWVA